MMLSTSLTHVFVKSLPAVSHMASIDLDTILFILLAHVRVTLAL